MFNAFYYLVIDTLIKYMSCIHDCIGDDGRILAPTPEISEESIRDMINDEMKRQRVKL